MAMTYDQLVQALKDFVVEGDEATFNDNIDLFIDLAEKMIYRTVRGLPIQKKLVTGSATAGQKYLGKPSDYLHSYSMAVIANGSYNMLKPKAESFIYASYPGGTQGVPKYYSELDAGSFLLGPTPDQSYTMEHHYFYFPPSIVTQRSGTWLSTNGPQALLYGTVLQGYTFIKGDQDLFKVYQTQYEVGIDQLRSLVVDQHNDSFRSGEPE